MATVKNYYVMLHFHMLTRCPWINGCENMHPGTVVMKQEEVVSPGKNGELQEKCLFVSEVIK